MENFKNKHKCFINHRDLVEYQLRKRKLRDVWIGLGFIMLFLPVNLTICLAIFSGFVSLMFLDEKPYNI